MAAVQHNIHGTAIAVAGSAALIRGASGTGKSDLALRCITAPVSALLPDRAELVADDRVEVEARGPGLVVRAPAKLRGLIEVRGIGIIAAPARAEATLALIVDLVRGTGLERLPDPVPVVDLFGVRLPLFHLDPFEAAAPQKLLLRLVLCGKMGPHAGNHAP